MINQLEKNLKHNTTYFHVNVWRGGIGTWKNVRIRNTYVKQSLYFFKCLSYNFNLLILSFLFLFLSHIHTYTHTYTHVYSLSHAHLHTHKFTYALSPTDDRLSTAMISLFSNFSFSDTFHI